jgi:hypothetical protein
LGASDGVIHSRISQEAVSLRATANTYLESILDVSTFRVRNPLMWWPAARTGGLRAAAGAIPGLRLGTRRRNSEAELGDGGRTLSSEFRARVSQHRLGVLRQIVGLWSATWGVETTMMMPSKLPLLSASLQEKIGATIPKVQTFNPVSKSRRAQSWFESSLGSGEIVVGGLRPIRVRRSRR